MWMSWLSHRWYDERVIEYAVFGDCEGSRANSRLQGVSMIQGVSMMSNE